MFCAYSSIFYVIEPYRNPLLFMRYAFYGSYRVFPS